MLIKNFRFLLAITSCPFLNLLSFLVGTSLMFDSYLPRDLFRLRFLRSIFLTVRLVTWNFSFGISLLSFGFWFWFVFNILFVYFSWNRNFLCLLLFWISRFKLFKFSHLFNFFCLIFHDLLHREDCRWVKSGHLTRHKWWKFCKWKFLFYLWHFKTILHEVWHSVHWTNIATRIGAHNSWRTHSCFHSRCFLL